MAYIKPKYIESGMKKFLNGLMIFSASFAAVLLIIVIAGNFVKVDEKLPNKRFILTEEMPKETANRLLAHLNIKMLKFFDNSVSMITCFDANDDGLVAVGLDDRVAIYDSNGLFKYGYSFSTTGTFYVEWEGSNLWIYLEKSDVGILLDRQANCLKCINIHDSHSEDCHWRELTYTQRKIGDDIYRLRNRKITKTDGEGQIRTILDTSIVWKVQVVFAIIVIAGLCAVIWWDSK